MTETNQHYVCVGNCNGVSDEPKSCGAETCDKHDEPLTPCECADGEHAEARGENGQE